MFATEAEKELDADGSLLDLVEAGAPAVFRTWRTSAATVVVGRSVAITDEVDEAFCAAHEISIVRRASGGRSVLVGPGTLQYSFVLPYELDEELLTIAGSKLFCNRILIAALARAAPASSGTITADPSGDLVYGGRKIAGLALRRRRRAMLLHGTILLTANLDLIGAALLHPKQEPPYRAGRAHASFLANLGPLDDRSLTAPVHEHLAARERASRAGRC